MKLRSADRYIYSRRVSKEHPMRFLRVAVPVTLVVALALGATPQADQSAAKANPTISQFLGAASPI